MKLITPLRIVPTSVNYVALLPSFLRLHKANPKYTRNGEKVVFWDIISYILVG